MCARLFFTTSLALLAVSALSPVLAQQPLRVAEASALRSTLQALGVAVETFESAEMLCARPGILCQSNAVRHIKLCVLFLL